MWDILPHLQSLRRFFSRMLNSLAPPVRRLHRHHYLHRCVWRDARSGRHYRSIVRGNEAWPQVTAVRGGRGGRWDNWRQLKRWLQGLGEGSGGQRGGIYSQLVGGNKRTARSPRDFLLPSCDEGGAWRESEEVRVEVKANDRLLHWESHLSDNKGFCFLWTKLCSLHRMQTTLVCKNLPVWTLRADSWGLCLPPYPCLQYII